MSEKIRRWYAPEVLMKQGEGCAPVCLSGDVEKLETEIEQLKAERDELKCCGNCDRIDPNADGNKSQRIWCELEKQFVWPCKYCEDWEKR